MLSQVKPLYNKTTTHKDNVDVDVDITRHSVCVLYVLCMEFELTVC